ncbi:GAF sensor signal transduction histidine kinase [Methylobacterium sp. 4-46]|uniref:ATP-binding protein n=1 Tax=unclassified Methylobacterium TaxID=2615210 RepID=UPI000165C9C9|nr:MULTISPECIES: ATP-binding protein [Methylobacterium]ACA16667.1 GAF sensor signal transduction histidine kinase [Methylobacterium sp. 4-46]WFT82369.1 GAF domain-containing protein [Methylobacterium nodulans]
MSSAARLPETVELTACDREPIHILGTIQPHGFLLAVQGPDLRIVQISDNVPDRSGRPVAALLGQPLREAFPELRDAVASGMAEHAEREGARYLRTLTLANRAGPTAYDLALHRSEGLIVLELEESSEAAGTDASLDALHPRLNAFVEGLHGAGSVPELCALLARDIRHITGFDRALVYRFDRDWNGTVVAEDGNGVLPSYLDLRFPASDIPAQARELYRRNRLRIIPDAAYAPVPIRPTLTPSSGRPLDLSQSILRSVSPVHVEYMRNMGTMASMSVSILVDGALWGLISCHNKIPRRVPLQARNACDFLTRIFALQLASKERGALAEQRLRLGGIAARLLGHMAEEESFLDGLLRHPEDVLALADAAGAAIVTGEQCRLLGETPGEDAVRGLYAWLAHAHPDEDVVVTDALGEALPEARIHAARASGLLAISISKRYASYVLWFRPEVVRTVRWGGNPAKPATRNEADGSVRLHPRRSFEIWKETVQGRSLPWSEAEIDAAKDLRAAVLGIVLRRAEELAAMTDELTRSNKELEAFSYSVSHDLRAPFRHIVGYSELLRSREGDRLTEKGRHYVDTIIEAAFSAGTLVDNLLTFSQMGRNALNRVSGDMNLLVEEVRRKVMRDVPPERSIRWQVGSLGRVYADPLMLRLVVENLLSNAVKYTRGRDEAVIEVGRGPDAEGEAIFFVRDNGVGFDMAYVNKLFGVFQRLHRVEEFEGTGIGLANVRRIVERHGGRTWAEGSLGAGATFHFTLPTRPEARHRG